MSVDNRFHVWHATVTHFNVVLVKDFVKFVLSWEMPLYQVEEESSDVGGDVVVVRGVKPDVVTFIYIVLLRKYNKTLT